MKLKNLEDARINEKNEVKNKMNELKETISSLRSHNHELEKEAMEARHKLGLVGGDISRYTTELEHLQNELTKSETIRLQKEVEYNKEIKASQAKEAQLLQQRDEVLTHLLAYSLTHSLTYLLTYLLTRSLAYLLTYLLTRHYISCQRLQLNLISCNTNYVIRKVRIGMSCNERRTWKPK